MARRPRARAPPQVLGVVLVAAPRASETAGTLKTKKAAETGTVAQRVGRRPIFLAERPVAEQRAIGQMAPLRLKTALAQRKVHLVVVAVAAVLRRRAVPRLQRRPGAFSGGVQTETQRPVANNAPVAAVPVKPPQRRVAVAAVSEPRPKVADLPDTERLIRPQRRVLRPKRQTPQRGR